MATYFSYFLVFASAITGVIWLTYALLTRKQQNSTEQTETVGETETDSTTSTHAQLVEGATANDELPTVVDFSKQLFPIFFGVMIFRSFIYEPFQIPSGSMFPTLLVGDFLLVEKFSYSLRDPLARKEIIKTGNVERGDVVVFKYPENEKLDYIKRVVGLPGDTIIYRNKQLFIQPACTGKPCPEMEAVSLKSLGAAQPDIHGAYGNLFEEQLGDKTHLLLRNPTRPNSGTYRRVVGDGEYIVFGDNRDNSEDSRVWGAVPEENIVGKAVFVWMSLEFERQQTDFLPTFVPTGIRFDRIGSIE